MPDLIITPDVVERGARAMYTASLANAGPHCDTFDELPACWRRTLAIQARACLTEALRPAPTRGLLGIPWRAAFALQDDGWILRNDIIWHKSNAMPESVTDRLCAGRSPSARQVRTPAPTPSMAATPATCGPSPRSHSPEPTSPRCHPLSLSAVSKPGASRVQAGWHSARSILRLGHDRLRVTVADTSASTSTATTSH